MTDLRFAPSAVEQWPIERLLPYAGTVQPKRAMDAAILAI